MFKKSLGTYTHKRVGFLANKTIGINVIVVLNNMESLL